MAECNKDNYGELCWLEIPVYDFARAKNLYTDIFNWSIKDEPMTVDDHGVAKIYFLGKGSLNGAFLLMQEGYHSTKFGALDKEVLPPLPTFRVADCDETLEKVKDRGGKVQCPKTAIGGGEMGYSARFTDTEGNVIGIWSQK